VITLRILLGRSEDFGLLQDTSKKELYKLFVNLSSRLWGCPQLRTSAVRGRGCPVQTSGVLQIWTSALFDAKSFGFFEIYGVSARTRGFEPVGTKGEGAIFLNSVRTPFMDGPFLKSGNNQEDSMLLLAVNQPIWQVAYCKVLHSMTNG